MIEYLKSVDQTNVQLLLTVLLVVLYLSFVKIAARIIRRYGIKNGISMPRIAYTSKFVRFLSFLVALLLLGLIWDIYFQGLSQYFISFFAVAGVALFASWSILSNITAAIILFFYFPYRIGEKIRIIDGENSIEGMVVDLNLFSIIIKTENGQRITYPNNLALQKGILHLEN